MDKSSQDLVGAAVRGGGLLMFLAVLQRGSTFILNILLQRAAIGTAAFKAYGAASISLELLLSTILFLSREPFRLALARDETKLEGARGRQVLVNVAWLSAPIGGVTAVLVCWLHPYIIGSGLDNLDMQHAITVTCVAAALEMLCEPLVLIFQVRLLLNVRVRAESAAVLVLGVSKYLFMSFGGFSVTAFSYAQLLYSFTLMSSYGLAVRSELKRRLHKTHVETIKEREGRSEVNGFERLPTWLPTGIWCSAATRQMERIGLLAGQSVFKHVLTEGDKLVLAHQSSNSLYHQAVYAVAQNYGSLVARLIFQPVEEAARLLFAKLDGKADGLKLAGHLLSVLLKLVLLVGSIFPCIGFSYTHVLMMLIMSGRKTDKSTSSAVDEVAQVLSWFCVYVMFLALNGMCEAFVYAVAKTRQVSGLSVSLLACFAVFWASAGPLMERFGTKGLVMANCLGMGFRVLYSGWFIRRHLGSVQPLRAALPTPQLAMALACATVVTVISANMCTEAGYTLTAMAYHVGRGILCILGVAMVLWRYESKFLQDVRRLYDASRQQVEQKKSD